LEEEARMMWKWVEELDERLTQLGGDAAGIGSEIDFAIAGHKKPRPRTPRRAHDR
jgi:hypothetical protein